MKWYNCRADVIGNSIFICLWNAENKNGERQVC